MSKPDYQLIEDIDLNAHVLATHGVFIDKDFGSVVTAPDFSAETLSRKDEMKLLNKYAENGKQFLRDELHLTDNDFLSKHYGIVLGITGWVTVDFDITDNNEPHTFGDYFLKLPPINQELYFTEYEDAVHQAKRMVTVYRQPWKIYQENGDKPLLINTFDFHPGHPIAGPMSDGYDKYAVPVYLYIVF